MSDTKQSGGQTPRYKLLEKAYINDKLLDPTTMPTDPETGEPRPLIIAYEGIPGWHMEPVNDAARAMKAKHPSRYADPILSMTQITEPAAAAKA